MQFRQFLSFWLIGFVLIGCKVTEPMDEEEGGLPSKVEIEQLARLHLDKDRLINSFRYKAGFAPMQDFDEWELSALNSRAADSHVLRQIGSCQADGDLPLRQRGLPSKGSYGLAIWGSETCPMAHNIEFKVRGKKRNMTIDYENEFFTRGIQLEAITDIRQWFFEGEWRIRDVRKNLSIEGELSGSMTHTKFGRTKVSWIYNLKKSGDRISGSIVYQLNINERKIVVKKVYSKSKQIIYTVNGSKLNSNIFLKTFGTIFENEAFRVEDL